MYGKRRQLFCIIIMITLFCSSCSYSFYVEYQPPVLPIKIVFSDGQIELQLLFYVNNAVLFF